MWGSDDERDRRERRELGWDNKRWKWLQKIMIRVGRSFEVVVAFFADGCQQWPMFKGGIASQIFEIGITTRSGHFGAKDKAHPFNNFASLHCLLSKK
jgi:hypothetical protein